MDAKVIEMLFKQIGTAHKEIQVLYELSEAESILLTQIIMELPMGSLSPKLASKLLRAAAHYLEVCDDLAQKIVKDKQ